MNNDFDWLDFMIWNSPQIKKELNTIQKEFDQIFTSKQSNIQTLVKSKKEKIVQKCSQIAVLWAEINEELGQT